MMLSGLTTLTRKILLNLVSPKLQQQPCSVDLTLKAIYQYTSSGTIDLSNAHRRLPTTQQLHFSNSDPSKVSQNQANDSSAQSTAEHSHDESTSSLHLSPGVYVIEYNERLAIPLDAVGHAYARSSLWRSGAVIHSGVMDAGYAGAFGGLLQVMNPFGITLHENARVAQAVFHEMGEGVGEGYQGVYQNAGRIG